MKSFMLILALAVFSFFSVEGAFAFPEMQRHGYVNCTTCHVSPNGGGALTEYGRALITEALSTWGTEAEASTAYLIESKPEWLDLGGDFRTLYLYRNNPDFKEGQWIFMQADLETRVKYKGISIGGTVGVKEEQVSAEESEYPFISRQHYLMWNIDNKIAVRAGRFHTAFGINIPDHYSTIKRGLGFDQEEENYNLEFSYSGESWSHFVSGFVGQPDRVEDQRESGFALRSTYAPTEKLKFGFSLYKAQHATERRFLLGPFAIIGFTEHLFLLSEMDLQWKTTKATNARARGFFSYHKLGWEFYKGFIAYFAQENQFADLNDSSTHAYSHGVGMQWFPRPHFELQVNFAKMKSARFNRSYTDQGWFLFHFYL